MSLDCPFLITLRFSLMLPVSLDCPFLITLRFSLMLPVSLDCPFLITLRFSLMLPVSLDCPFLITLRFSLMLPVSLDCPFLITLRFSPTYIYHVFPHKRKKISHLLDRMICFFHFNKIDHVTCLYKYSASNITHLER